MKTGGKREQEEREREKYFFLLVTYLLDSEKVKRGLNKQMKPKHIKLSFMFDLKIILINFLIMFVNVAFR